MLTKQTNKYFMDRAEAIKFKLMPGGHIRAYDSRTISGISEAHVYPPQVTAPTILTKGDHVKFMIADEAIYRALQHALLR